MLHDSAKLGELTLHATDGEIGHVDDVYFSDDTWAIRYLVVDTGGWLTGRKVLISPRAVRSLDRIRTSAEYEPQAAATDEGRQKLQERIEHALHFGD